MAGEHGTSTTLLYWPGRSTGASDQDSINPRKHSDNSDLKASRHSLTLARASKSARPAKPSTPAPLSQIGREDETVVAQQGEALTAPRAGSSFGTLSEGPLSGDEIRPALPIRPFDPVIGRTEVANAHEGDVIIEVTIDEKGTVVKTIILQSLSPEIDAKVVAALENWRFYPAMRDGIAIASKQDVHYHFRDR